MGLVHGSHVPSNTVLQVDRSREIRRSDPVPYHHDMEDMKANRPVIRDLPEMAPEAMSVRQAGLVSGRVLFAVLTIRPAPHRRIALLEAGLFQKVLR